MSTKQQSNNFLLTSANSHTEMLSWRLASIPTPTQHYFPPLAILQWERIQAHPRIWVPASKMYVELGPITTHNL